MRAFSYGYCRIGGGRCTCHVAIILTRTGRGKSAPPRPHVKARQPIFACIYYQTYRYQIRSRVQLYQVSIMQSVVPPNVLPLKLAGTAPQHRIFETSDQIFMNVSGRIGNSAPLRQDEGSA